MTIWRRKKRSLAHCYSSTLLLREDRAEKSDIIRNFGPSQTGIWAEKLGPACSYLPIDTADVDYMPPFSSLRAIQARSIVMDMKIMQPPIAYRQISITITFSCPFFSSSSSSNFLGLFLYLVTFERCKTFRVSSISCVGIQHFSLLARAKLNYFAIN